MKNLARFIKTTLAGGFFVILPAVLIGLLVAETIGIFVGLVQPVAELFPVEELGGIGIAKIVAVVTLLACCFVVGLLMRTRRGTRLGRAFEQRFLMPIPGYQLLKSISQRFAGADDERFVPCLVSSNGRYLIGFAMDEHDNGLVTVFLPRAPTPTAGSLEIVPKESVRHLDASMGEVLDSFFHYGIGSGTLLGRIERD